VLVELEPVVDPLEALLAATEHIFHLIDIQS
jgi:hypothetical protein